MRRIQCQTDRVRVAARHHSARRREPEIITCSADQDGGATRQAQVHEGLAVGAPHPWLPAFPAVSLVPPLNRAILGMKQHPARTQEIKSFGVASFSSARSEPSTRPPLARTIKARGSCHCRDATKKVISKLGHRRDLPKTRAAIGQT